MIKTVNSLQPDTPIYKFPRSDASDPALPPGRSYALVEDGHTFSVDGATLTAVHTPGHTTDHIVLHLKVTD